jgi:hypothetical protein
VILHDDDDDDDDDDGDDDEQVEVEQVFCEEVHAISDCWVSSVAGQMESEVSSVAALIGSRRGEE